MNGIWSILELEPTKDISAIKQAYAQKTRTCHPEEDPQGFLELRKAYQAALHYAEQENIFLQEPPQEQEENHDKEEGWILPEELSEAGANPLCDGEAVRRFMEIYTGTQQKNPRVWMEYFTSDVFLDVAWDSRFTALLLEKVNETEQEFPPGKEFQMWLNVVYLFSEREEAEYNQGQFLAAVLCIAAKGPMPKRLGGDELAIRESFKDYRHLVRLADSGIWNEQALEEFKWIVGRYSSSYIKERCDPKANPDCQRHPAGLRVFTHFFQRCDLPEEICQIVWRKLGLESIRVGRMKILYGALRDLVVERVSDIGGGDPENLLQLNYDRNACFARIQAAPEQEERELAAYFSQEKVQKVLRNRWFVEEQLLAYSNWLNPTTPEGAVRWLLEFYQENQDIWGWDRVVERAKQELEERKREKEEAAEAAGPVELDLSLMLEFPKRVYAKSLTESEHVFCFGKKSDTGSKDDQRKKRMTDKEWEDFKDGGKWEYMEVETDELLAALGEIKKEEENAENADLLTEEGFVALFDQFGEGKLTRLEIEFGQTTLVLARDQDKYACFCFEESEDTWFSMLSQPNVYKTIDCAYVEYMPFGMGELAIYCIHKSPFSILRNMNLVFMQIGRGRIQVRVGDCWLWSSHTDLHNGRFKKYMAMQKLAQIPVRHSDGHILAKFVFSQYPDWVETVSQSGERTLARLRTGSYDLAVGSLVQFFQQKLTKLRLSWEPKGKMDQAGLRHIILLQENGQFMMAWLQDGKEQASFYASDAPRIFLGHVYPACLVHRDLKRIRNCLDLILDDMARAELVTDRPGEFVPIDCPYVQVREGLVDEEL